MQSGDARETYSWRAQTSGPQRDAESSERQGYGSEKAWTRPSGRGILAPGQTDRVPSADTLLKLRPRAAAHDECKATSWSVELGVVHNAMAVRALQGLDTF